MKIQVIILAFLLFFCLSCTKQESKPPSNGKTILDTPKIVKENKKELSINEKVEKIDAEIKMIEENIKNKSIKKVILKKGGDVGEPYLAKYLSNSKIVKLEYGCYGEDSGGGWSLYFRDSIPCFMNITEWVVPELDPKGNSNLKYYLEYNKTIMLFDVIKKKEISQDSKAYKQAQADANKVLKETRKYIK